MVDGPDGWCWSVFVACFMIFVSIGIGSKGDLDTYSRKVLRGANEVSDSSIF